MAKLEPSRVRNVCLVGHSDCGKTSIADAILFKTGVVKRPGRVADGTSVFDYDDQEKAKGHSIELAQASFDWDGNHINLIDTPGYPDFIGDAVAAISASDGVVICVNAQQGVQVNTRRVFDIAVKLGKARILALTKCDQDGVDFEACVADLQTWFGDACIPVTIPQGFGPDFQATRKLLHDRGGDSERGRAFYQAFVENAVEVDDEVLGAYLEGKEIPDEVLKRCFVRAACEGLLTPIISTSVEKDIGLRDMLDCFSVFVPSPDSAGRRRHSYAADGGDRQPIDDPIDGPFYGQVFKVHIDKHVGKVAYLKVVAGALADGDVVFNSDRGKKEKIGHLAEPFGKELRPISSAKIGDTIAITKMESLHLGDTLSTANEGRRLRPIPFPRPMAQVAVRPAKRGDETKIAEALSKLSDEISTFQVDRDPVTHEAIAAGVSSLQLDLVFQRLRERYGIEVETSPARVAYRETMTVPAEGHYRHKKQSGGRGQFGEVYLRVSPAEPGSGLRLDWDIVGGSIPSNFQPAIEKGIRGRMEQGIISGHPMLDARVSVYDGKFHDVDSSEAAFKIAGGRAFAEAVMKARPALLEPIVAAEIVVPGQHMGDITGDLNTRRGRIQGMEAKGQYQVIEALVPKSEMAEYPRVITALTSGEGSFTYEEVGYEQVPPQVQQQIVAAWKPREEQE